MSAADIKRAHDAVVTAFADPAVKEAMAKQGNVIDVSSSAYAKVERRVGDWAVAAAGSAVTLDGDQIVTGRVGLTAVNADSEALAAVTEALVGSPPTEETFAEAGRLAAQACEPATDQRGTADYKRHLASELTIRTLRTAVQRVRDIPDPKGT